MAGGQFFTGNYAQLAQRLHSDTMLKVTIKQALQNGDLKNMNPEDAQAFIQMIKQAKQLCDPELVQYFIGLYRKLVAEGVNSTHPLAGVMDILIK
jgi:hypothetical protein